jgi:hypothetical protein
VRSRVLGLLLGSGLGWVWSRGVGPWPLGRWVRWPPVTPTGTGAGSSAPPPPPYRRLPASGGWGCGRACSRLIGLGRSSKHMPRHGLNSPSFGKAPSDRPKLPSHAHFHNLARSCADSDWRSGVNEGRGSPFRHTPGCTARRWMSWAPPSRGLALWLRGPRGG